jgi:NADPH:quinone reductase-like Zn-dependent oxidoreductase
MSTNRAVIVDPDAPGRLVIRPVQEPAPPPEVTFDAREFFVAGRTTLYGLYLFTELGSEPASVGLRRLAELVAAGQLAPHISLERPWAEVAKVAQDLMARRFSGKAVLTLDWSTPILGEEAVR